MDRKAFFEKITKLHDIVLKQAERAKLKAEDSSSSKEELAEEIRLITMTMVALEATNKSLLKEAVSMMGIAVKNFEIGNTLIKANERIAEVVSFYADEENWKSSGRKKSAAAIDSGQKARLLLKGDGKNTPNE